MSLIVISKIKYTEQYSYNKERISSKIFDFDNDVARGYNCMEKVHIYQTIF